MSTLASEVIPATLHAMLLEKKEHSMKHMFSMVSFQVQRCGRCSPWVQKSEHGRFLSSTWPGNEAKTLSALKTHLAKSVYSEKLNHLCRCAIVCSTR